MKYRFAVALALVMGSGAVNASETGVFVGYELFEMSMNKFKNFAGEIGYQYDDRNSVRLTMMEVNLTERHLSSDTEAYAVKGKHVEGYFQGYELHYDHFFSPRWYVSMNVGHYNDTYQHTQLDEKIENHTNTIGTGIGFRQDNLLGVKGLWLDFDNPFRYYFNDIKKQKLGDTTIREHRLVNNMWLFLGYKF